MDKPLRVHVELAVFKESHIQLSHYHGCAMEVPVIRCLPTNAPKIFYEIATFMKASLGTYPYHVATDEEIEEV